MAASTAAGRKRSSSSQESEGSPTKRTRSSASSKSSGSSSTRSPRSQGGSRIQFGGKRLPSPPAVNDGDDDDENEGSGSKESSPAATEKVTVKFASKKPVAAEKTTGLGKGKPTGKQAGKPTAGKGPAGKSVAGKGPARKKLPSPKKAAKPRTKKGKSEEPFDPEISDDALTELIQKKTDQTVKYLATQLTPVIVQKVWKGLREMKKQKSAFVAASGSTGNDDDDSGDGTGQGGQPAQRRSVSRSSGARSGRTSGRSSRGSQRATPEEVPENDDSIRNEAEAPEEYHKCAICGHSDEPRIHVDRKTGEFITKRGSVGTSSYGKMIPCNQDCGNWYHSGKHCADIYGKKIRARNFRGPCCPKGSVSGESSGSVKGKRDQRAQSRQEKSESVAEEDDESEEE